MRKPALDLSDALSESCVTQMAVQRLDGLGRYPSFLGRATGVSSQSARVTNDATKHRLRCRRGTTAASDVPATNERRRGLCEPLRHPVTILIVEGNVAAFEVAEIVPETVPHGRGREED
jgi:hypothetical protein